MNKIKLNPNMSPLETLNSTKSKLVKVNTSEGKIYLGHLVNFDVFSNVLLRNVQFITEGNRRLEECLINGTNVTFIELVE